VIDLIWLPPRDSNPDMLIQSQLAVQCSDHTLRNAANKFDWPHAAGMEDAILFPSSKDELDELPDRRHMLQFL